MLLSHSAAPTAATDAPIVNIRMGRPGWGKEVQYLCTVIALGFQAGRNDEQEVGGKKRWYLKGVDAAVWCKKSLVIGAGYIVSKQTNNHAAYIESN